MRSIAASAKKTTDLFCHAAILTLKYNLYYIKNTVQSNISNVELLTRDQQVIGNLNPFKGRGVNSIGYTLPSRSNLQF